MKNNIAIHFIVPVWGREYIDSFVKFCLPSLLSPLNLPNIKNAKNIFTICTSEEEKKKLLKEKNINNLQKFIKVQIITIDDILNENEKSSDIYRCQNHFLKMTKAHNKAISTTKNEDIAYSFIMPDNVFFNGSIANIISKLNHNNRVLYSYGLHVQKERFYKKLKESNCIRKDSLNVDTLDLATYAMDNLHFASQRSFIDSKPFLPNGNLFFKKNSMVFLKLCYLHPFVVYPSKQARFIPDNSTFDDGDYIKLISYKRERKKILDSREFFMYSLDSKKSKEQLHRYFTSTFNIFEQASRIKNIDSFYLNNLESTCTLYSKRNQKIEVEQFEAIYTLLQFLLKHDKFIPDIQAIKVDIATSQKPYLIHKKVSENFLKILEKLLSSKHIEHKIKKHYKVIYKDVQLIKDKFKENTNKIKLLESIEKIFDKLNFNQKTNVFKLQDLKRRVRQIENIMNKYDSVSIYAAGDDTKILLGLINNRDNIYAIYDENPEKIGTKISGIEIKKYVPRETKESLIICSTLYEEQIYDKLNKNKNIILYTLNKRKGHL